MKKIESATTKMARMLGKRGGDKTKETRGVDYFKEIGKRGGQKRWKLKTTKDK